MIKAVFLDFAGVVSQSGAMSEGIVEFYPDNFTLAKSKELFALAKIGEMGDKEYMKNYSDECLDWYFGQATEHEGIMNFLTKNNLPLFVASNHVTSWIQREIDTFGVREYFKDFFISSELKLAKPHKEFYEEILKRSGFKAEESVFVDDQKRNLVVPKELGMKTVWVDNTKVDHYGDNADIDPNFSIYKIDELLEIIEKLNSK
jgi:HAD superfamily hydrolase (TIGR01509 family)